jgi:hypothetical protein
VTVDDVAQNGLSEMKLSEVAEGSRFLDVDGIPVVLLPTGRCVAFDKRDGSSYPYPNEQKAGMEGDALSRAEFAEWLSTGFNRFDTKP